MLYLLRTADPTDGGQSPRPFLIRSFTWRAGPSSWIRLYIVSFLQCYSIRESLRCCAAWVCQGYVCSRPNEVWGKGRVECAQSIKWIKPKLLLCWAFSIFLRPPIYIQKKEQKERHTGCSDPTVKKSQPTAVGREPCNRPGQQSWCRIVIKADLLVSARGRSLPCCSLLFQCHALLAHPLPRRRLS